MDASSIRAHFVSKKGQTIDGLESARVRIIDATGSKIRAQRVSSSKDDSRVDVVLSELVELVDRVLDQDGPTHKELRKGSRRDSAVVGALLADLPCVEAPGARSGDRYRPAVGWIPPSIDTSQLEDLEAETIEGRPRLIQHLVRERDHQLVASKKRAVAKATGTLACEVCNFDFAAFYGPAYGENVAEAHHVIPLAVGERTSTLDDLAIVCANCHRILHKANVSVSALRSVVEARRR